MGNTGRARSITVWLALVGVLALTNGATILETGQSTSTTTQVYCVDITPD